jgi:hypothetical protein
MFTTKEIREMKPKTFVLAVSCSLLALVATAATVHAYDLTGTWVGKWSCKGFDGEKFTSFNKTSTLRLTQTGNTIAADIDNGEYRYNGGMIADDAKPEKGEAVFITCAIDNLPLTDTETEMIRVAVKTKTGTFKASFKGLSIFEDNLGGVGTCKYSFKRQDTVNPNISACPS